MGRHDICASGLASVVLGAVVWACSGNVSGSRVSDGGPSGGSAGVGMIVRDGGSVGTGGATVGAGGSGPTAVGGVGGASAPRCTNGSCSQCQSCYDACLCQTRDAAQCVQACSSGSGGVGGSGGSGSAGGGGSGGVVQCNPTGENGTPGTSCAADDPLDVCQVCLQSSCCEQWRWCVATDPLEPCAWGGPGGEGEVVCFQSCVLEAQLTGGIPDQQTVIFCRSRCATPGCSTISNRTDNLIACLMSNCFDPCLVLQ
jgi:hypothetical protein